jgi:hypothetical protein
MIKFPKFSREPAPIVRKMELREYAHFSELCLRSNPKITPGNCLTSSDNAANKVVAFRIPDSFNPGT